MKERGEERKEEKNVKEQDAQEGRMTVRERKAKDIMVEGANRG